MNSKAKSTSKIVGPHLLVLDARNVLVGSVVDTDDKDTLLITQTSVVRVWGTSAGLGELYSGPTSNTVLDPCGVVVVNKNKLIMAIKVAEDWPLV